MHGPIGVGGSPVIDSINVLKPAAEPVSFKGRCGRLLQCCEQMAKSRRKL